VSTATRGLGQSYFLSLPILSILGGVNASGEPRLDRNYPGYNFNISDQRRALEFIKDFDRMVAAGCPREISATCSRPTSAISFNRTITASRQTR